MSTDIVIFVVPIAATFGFVCCLLTCIFGVSYIIRRKNQQNLYGDGAQQQTVVFTKNNSYGQNQAYNNPPVINQYIQRRNNNY